jgi:MFS family permease
MVLMSGMEEDNFQDEEVIEEDDLGEYAEAFDEEYDDIEEIELEPREIIYFEPRMKPNEPGKLNKGRTALLAIAFLAALIALTYYNIAVPKILEELIADDFKFLFMQKSMFIGFLMTIDNILAITLQPIFASLSDRTESRFGRRLPYLMIGVVGGAMFFGFAPLVQVLGYFVGMLFCYNIMMASFRSPALALVPDYTEERLRSSASGLQQLVANIGTIIAFGGPIIVGFFVTNAMPKDERDVLIARIGFPIMSVFMIICLMIVIITVKETPTGKGFLRLSKEKIHIDNINFSITASDEEQIEDKKPRKKLREWSFFKIFTKQYSAILFLLLAVLFWIMGFAAIETFFTLLGTEYLGLDFNIATMLGVAYPGSMIAAAYPMGLLGKKIGRKKTIYICLGSEIVLLSIIAAVVIPLKSVLGLGLMIIVVGAFWMGVIVNTYPILWRLCPENEVSTFIGIFYIFNQTASVLGPLIMGGIFDIGTNRLATPNAEYWLLFPFMTLCVIIALGFFLLVKGGEAKETVKAGNDFY